MTPQSAFTVVVPIEPGRAGELGDLLASMNSTPGTADPHNALVPFGAFETLHFARFVVLDDRTTGDIAAYEPPPPLPTFLAFLGDCDGSADALLAELASRAQPGLRRIFGCCQGFSEGTDLLEFLKAHNRPPAALYVNWVGRTVRQIREEAALHQALRGHLDQHAQTLSSMPPREVHRTLQDYVAAETAGGRLTLSPPGPTPLGWQLRNALHLLGGPLLVLSLAPVLLAYLPVFAVQLRRRELSDPEIAPRVDPHHAQRLAEIEDHDVSNQFTAMGSIKPGLFRKYTLAAALAILDYSARHVYTRGHLARVSTIHFARWVPLPDERRLLFASNYDGSLESYMDDFINKVAFGLNLVFSNGIGFPSTRWLLFDGAKDEQKFKYYIRRHELPTGVWYDAHPGLDAVDLQKNTLIRQGLESRAMSDAKVTEWLNLI